MNSTSPANGANNTLPEVQVTLKNNLIAQFGERLGSIPDLAWREYGLAFSVSREDAFAVFKTLKDDPKFKFEMLVDVTAVDWLDSREKRFEVVYQLMSITLKHRLCLKISVGEDRPEVDSVRGLWDSANFLEREVWDMYGISFKGHGDLRRVLMYDEFVGHPLRKDYPLRGKQPRVPLRIPELRNTSPDMEREQLVSLPVRPGGGTKAALKSSPKS